MTHNQWVVDLHIHIENATRRSTYAGLEWNGVALMRMITGFEARMKHRPPLTLGRNSPYPRVLSLRELLKALKSADQTDDPSGDEM